MTMEDARMLRQVCSRQLLLCCCESQSYRGSTIQSLARPPGPYMTG